MTDRRPALLLGGGGMLARELLSALGAAGFHVTATSREECDITLPDDLAKTIARFRPDVVVNAAAYTAVDRAEVDEESATRTNAGGAAAVARAVAEAGGTLVHVSTDYVFDGEKRAPYVEEDAPRPLGAYGRSKRLGEQAVLASGARAYVVRTGELYGDGGSNFFDTILRRARAGLPLRVVDDQIVTPTWTRELASQIVAIVEHAPPGLYHATAEGEVSWYEAAMEALRLARIVADVTACSTEEYGSPTPRPRYSVLSHEKLASLGLYWMRPWGVALADWLGSRHG
jgi:dTDP-4-dehydrorhamnose reductase